ncbi:MAG: restriction endonuclease [Gemmatimonadaceae bacterium]
MTIPDYQTLMLPLLSLLRDGQDCTVRAARERIAQQFTLSEDELRQTVPSGKKLLFADRLSWATAYMKQAGLLESARRGVYRITRRGAEVLATEPTSIDNSVLERFAEFREFRARSVGTGSVESTPQAEDKTPDEQLDASYQRLRGNVEAELLSSVKAASPAFFERLVIALLVRMGYGGSLQDAGKAIGKTGDGGIDGVISEDRLGLDVIHIQAKRWDGKTVGRPDVQAFAGSLDGVRAKKGILITTSGFSADAHAYVERIEKRIVLIDGSRLARLMFDFGVGVAAVASYDIKRVDSDFFSEE